MKPMLELKHLCFEAETDAGVRQILKDVSLTVDERMVVITGPNGSGKSTMAKLIAGIEQPTSGQILLDGEDPPRHQLRFPAAGALQGHHGL